MTAASIRSWVQKAIQQTLAFLAGKDLMNNRIGVQHDAVEGVWRISPYAGGVYPSLADQLRDACMFAALNLGGWSEPAKSKNGKAKTASAH
jgi:hypothetical protein